MLVRDRWPLFAMSIDVDYNPAPPVTGCQFDKVVGKSDAKIESRHREKFKEMRIKG